MTNEVRLSLGLLFKILQRTSYYDTEMLGRINTRTTKIVKSERLWRKKVEWERRLSNERSKALKITNWRDFYLLMTDRLGGALAVPHGDQGIFDGLVNSTIITDAVIWLVTGGGLVYSLLRGDSTAIWTFSELNQPVRFLRLFGERSGYSVFAVTENDEIYLIKAANRGSRIVFRGRRISDLIYSSGIIHLLTSDGTVVDLNFDVEEISYYLSSTDPNTAVALLDTQNGPVLIKTIISQADGSYIFDTTRAERYRVSSGMERIKNTMISAPPAGVHLSSKELPEAPVEVDALDTATIFEPLSRAAGAEYDREGDFDLIDEEIITSRELLEGSDVG